MWTSGCARGTAPQTAPPATPAPESAACALDFVPCCKCKLELHNRAGAGWLRRCNGINLNVLVHDDDIPLPKRKIPWTYPLPLGSDFPVPYTVTLVSLRTRGEIGTLALTRSNKGVE